MKIKNITKQTIKIKLGDGKIYGFEPGRVRTLNKDLAEAVLKNYSNYFKEVK